MLRLGKGQEHEGFDGFRCYNSDMKSTTFTLEMREKYLSFREGTRAAVWEEVTQVRGHWTTTQQGLALYPPWWRDISQT